LVLVDFLLPIENMLPTLESLASSKNKVIAVSFFDKISLANHAGLLAEAMRRKFILLHDDVPKLPEYDVPHLYFAPSGKLLAQMRAGDIAVVENLNLLSKEQISTIVKLGEEFVNDDFGSDEDATHAIAGSMHSQNGLEYNRTKKNIDSFLSREKKPLVLILGGTKIAGKEAALEKLIPRASVVLVGGGIANLFFKLRGFEIGKSIVDPKANSATIKKLWRDYKSKIQLPIDVVVSSDPSGNAECVKPDKVKSHQMILDIGPQTTLEYSKYIKKGVALVWSGALGHVQQQKFKHGTSALLRLFASRSQNHVNAAASGESIMPILQSAGFLPQLDIAVPSSIGLLNALAK